MAKTVGLLCRSDGDAVPELGRFKNVVRVLRAHGLDPQVVLFSEERIEGVRAQLLTLDGVLVWVDPISGDRNRSFLDPLLREVSEQGIWVSAHPDVILKMGTKDVLVKTKGMPWGTDCLLYSSPAEMAQQLPQRLHAGPRVLKQHRGNGGNGVWKVELTENPASSDARVNVLHAQRGSSPEEMALADFFERCRSYFSGGGCMIEQPYQERLAEGMIRCYLTGDKVVGFGHQFVTALLPLPQGETQTPTPSPRLYYGPGKPEFQAIRALLEGSWVQEMQQLLGLGTLALPALWDADFLYGAKNANGEDTYVLCEINASSVSPFPDEALEPLAATVARRLGTSN